MHASKLALAAGLAALAAAGAAVAAPCYIVVDRNDTVVYRDVTPPFDFSLGGQLRLSAYNRNEFRGANYFYASPGYLHSLGSLSEVIGGRYYVGAWYEVGSAFNDWGTKDIRHAVAGGFLMNTKIGLITLGGAVGEGGRGRIFFSLGNVFR